MLGLMKTLLCFGDSNTHGTVPMHTPDEVARYGYSERWPGVLRAALGPAWCVLEEGLPGRTSALDDPEEGADRNALRYWQACLQSHRPLDAVVLMLGTNDLKARFQASPQSIAQGVEELIAVCWRQTPPGGAHPLLLLVAPAPIRELGFFSDIFAGGAAKSQQLSQVFGQVAERHGVLFLDAGAHCAVSAVDGIHLDVQAHQALGQAVAATLAQALAT